MSSGSKKQTVGYWYRILGHYGLVKGPIDAFLELRGGDRTAWSGLLEGSGRIRVNAPNLWGGKKSEGGLDGDLDLMFGEADQVQNDYLEAKLGPGSAYRGKVTAVWRGGRYGAMNPYPKTLAFKIRRILMGWDNDTPWYPEKASIELKVFSAADQDWRWLAVPNSDSVDRSSPSLDDSAWSIGRPPFGDKEFPLDVEPDNPGRHRFASVPATVVPQAMKVWMRASFPFEALPDEIRFQAFVDNDCILYVNGVQVLQVGDTNGRYYDVAIPTSAFVIGENHIAVCGWDRHSGEGNWFWFDWRLRGISALIGMNPAHILYDSVTAEDMQGEPIGLINEASFRAAADRFYHEGLGLCTMYDPDQEDIEQFQQRICDVVGCSLTQSRVDGQYYIDLVRGDYDLDGLPVISSDDILEFSQEPAVIGEMINQITVEWFDPETKQARTTPPIKSLGRIMAAGGVIPETKKYPEIAVESLALRIGARDLQAYSPLSRFSLTLNRRPWRIRPGTYFRLQVPEEGIADMVCVLGDIDTGTPTDGRCRIKAVQDVFAFPDTVYVSGAPSGAQPANPKPTGSPHQLLMEAPYVELVTRLSAADLAALPEDAGVLVAVATQADGGINYSIYSAGAGEDLADNGTGDWCPTAVINEPAGFLGQGFTFSNDEGLLNVVVGSWALWGSEIVRVDALDLDAATIILGRSCADTVPAKHAAGSRIYFCGDWGSTDGREYVDGETVTVKLLTRTGSDEQLLADATLLSLEMAQRQFRPYPPGQVKINGEAYPASISGQATITWVHRDRLMQADKLIDTTMGGVGPEAGTTYNLRIYSESNILVRTVTGIDGNSYAYAIEDEVSDGGGSLIEDPHWSLVKLLLNFDGADGSTTFVDSSASARGMSRSGAVALATGVKKYGAASAKFSGGSLQTANASADFDLSTGDWTMEFWVSPDLVTGSPHLLTIGNAEAYRATLYISNGTLIFWSKTTSSNYANRITTTISVGVWTHLCLERKGGVITLYKDGQSVGTTNTTVLPAGSLYMFFGTQPWGGLSGDIYYGYLDDLRLTMGVARYSGNFTPPEHALGRYDLGSARLNGRLRFELEAQRDGLVSWQYHDITVLRSGYGFNYGELYGGAA